MVCSTMFSTVGNFSLGNAVPSLSPYVAIGFLVAVSVLTGVVIHLYRAKQQLSRQIEAEKVRCENHSSLLRMLVGEADYESREREIEMINRLVAAIEFRDIETASHIARVAQYSRLIAKNIFPEDSPMPGLIFLGASLHDIGKIGISDEILSKPFPLNSTEFRQMKEHSRIGYEILKESSSPIIQMGAVISLTHHERYDGTGYPEGLKGTQIPIAGRIVAVADFFDALVSPRVYKQAWPVDKALGITRKLAGTDFDPQCVDAFFADIDSVLKIIQQNTNYAYSHTQAVG